MRHEPLSLPGMAALCLAMATENVFAQPEGLPTDSKDVQFTLYDDAGHDVWTRTYDDPKFWQWLARQKRQQSGEHP